jgi:hypothetical protein
VDIPVKLRVFVDYGTMFDDEKERVRLPTHIDKYLLGVLANGLPLVLYDDESMEVDAIAEYEPEYDFWYGVPDWCTRRDLPPLTQEQLAQIRKLRS